MGGSEVVVDTDTLFGIFTGVDATRSSAVGVAGDMLRGIQEYQPSKDSAPPRPVAGTFMGSGEHPAGHAAPSFTTAGLHMTAVDTTLLTVTTSRWTILKAAGLYETV